VIDPRVGCGKDNGDGSADISRRDKIMAVITVDMGSIGCGTPK